MYETSYKRAGSVADATAAMKSAEDGKFLGGGMTLLPTMKARLAAPSDLIDLTHIAEMQGISREGDLLVIGGGTTHAAVASSDVVRAAIPALADLASHIGDPAVRNRGTLGGSVANNDPAADYPAAVLGLGATVVTDRREIAAEDFFEGMFVTALEEDEVITAIKFPIPQKAAYMKFPNPASRYAMAGVMVAATGAGARVAVTGAGNDGVFRFAAAETALDGNWSEAALSGVSVDAGDMLGDIHGTPEYRANLVAVMTRRAVAKAG